MRRALLTTAVLICVAAPAAGTAFAQSAGPSPLAGKSQTPAAAEAKAPAAAGAQAEGDGLEQRLGSLPFTGIDVLVLFGSAMVLTGFGFALRRISAPWDEWIER